MPIDVSKMSDADLEAISKDDFSKVSDDGLKYIHDASQPSMVERGYEAAKDVGKAAIGALGFVNDKLDTYARAPLRAAAGAAIDGQNPYQAFHNQWGTDPAAAPSGVQLAEKLGIPDDKIPQSLIDAAAPLPIALASRLGVINPTYRGTAGMAIDAGLDATNALPLAGRALKGAGALAKGTAALAEGSVIGNAAEAAASKVAGAVSSIPAKIGELITGIPKHAIETYATQADEINKMVKETGGSLPELADSIRGGFQKKIASFRMAEGSKIQTALEAASPERSLEVQPIIDRIGEVHSRINPATHPEEAAHLEELADRVAKIAGDEGKVNASEMFDIKEMLQDAGKRSYEKGGQIFNRGTKAQLGAKHAAAEARQILDHAVPEVADANKSLYELHRIEDKINPNLINPGASDAALSAAGSGANPRNRMMLKKLGKVTGEDFLPDTDRLGAAKYFSDPKFAPVDATGKSLTRVGAGAAVGAAAAHTLGLPVTWGAAAGTTLASPAMLKMAIDAGRIPVEIVHVLAGSAGKLTDAALAKAAAILKTPEGAAILEGYLQRSEALGASPQEPSRDVSSVPENAMQRRLQNGK